MFISYTSICKVHQIHYLKSVLRTSLCYKQSRSDFPRVSLRKRRVRLKTFCWPFMLFQIHCEPLNVFKKQSGIENKTQEVLDDDSKNGTRIFSTKMCKYVACGARLALKLCAKFSIFLHTRIGFIHSSNCKPKLFIFLLLNVHFDTLHA